MSNINELNQKIAILNAESKRLNNERAVNLGKKDTLTKQLNAAIASYNEKYGRNISVDTIDYEMKNVMDSKEREINTIEAVLNAIKSGNYDEANRLSGVTTQEVPQPVVQEPVVNESVISQPVVKEPVVQEPVIKEPVVPSKPLELNNMEVSVEPVAPTIPTPPTSPKPVSPSAPSGLAMPTPPSLSSLDLSTPDPIPSSPTSFSAILGGTEFSL